jgi:glycosyltransferase involved in cell wall biosynthesis
MSVLIKSRKASLNLERRWQCGLSNYAGHLEGISGNQFPDRKNPVRQQIRKLISIAPTVGIVAKPSRPQGISVLIRAKNEKDWIRASISSIKGIADEIVIVDNGSTDGTYEKLLEVQRADPCRVQLWKCEELDVCSISNFGLSQTRFKWVFRWDADMVAHTSGKNDIAGLRERILELDPQRYFLIYLRHINLAGDLLHQDSREMVHIEEYIHTFSENAKYIHPGRFEAIKFPKYYQPLFLYEPYGFHVDVKPRRRMLLRYFWEKWMEGKDYNRFPSLEDFVSENIQEEFGTKSWKEAENNCFQKVSSNYIPYDKSTFGEYPDLLKPHLEEPKYLMQYRGGRIVDRIEP